MVTTLVSRHQTPDSAVLCVFAALFFFAVDVEGVRRPHSVELGGVCGGRNFLLPDFQSGSEAPDVVSMAD